MSRLFIHLNFKLKFFVSAFFLLLTLLYLTTSNTPGRETSLSPTFAGKNIYGYIKSGNLNDFIDSVSYLSVGQNSNYKIKIRSASNFVLPEFLGNKHTETGKQLSRIDIFELGDCGLQNFCFLNNSLDFLITDSKDWQSGFDDNKFASGVSGTKKWAVSSSTAASFTNSAAIAIPVLNSGVNGAGPASVYASNIVVSALSGTITDINVKINGFSHTFPNDIAMLLVSPVGQKYILQSDVGGKADVTNISYTFDDQAAESISSSAFPANNSVVKPSSIGNDDILLSPAPLPPYEHPAPAGTATLNGVFGGLSPNGSWQLFVFDFFAGNSGSISGGWSLEIATTAEASPSITGINPNSQISGGNAFELTVNGNNFNTNSVVRWNGQNKATTLVSNSQLKAQIPGSDTQISGLYPITVSNSQSGGEISNSVNFTVIGCSYSISSSLNVFTNAGGSGTINISTLTGCPWTAQTNNPWITLTSTSTGSGNGFVNFTVASNTGLERNGAITVAGQTLSINQSGRPLSVFCDFDGDGKADVSVYRPSTGVWYLNRSQAGFTTAQFGSFTDKIVPADFTGDGKTDIAFWRESTGEWFIIRSEDASFYAFPFGQSGDITIPADFDGDGRADPTVFRPSNAIWYSILSSSGQISIRQFGASGDIPQPNDFDGDGKSDIAIFRPGVSEWWINKSSDNSVSAVKFGESGDKAVPADFTGDGKTDVAFWRPSSGFWYVLRSEDNSYYAFPFGSIGDTPVAGDYDGDGKADAAVFRSSNTVWYMQRSTAGFSAVQFGLTSDQPVPSAYTP